MVVLEDLVRILGPVPVLVREGLNMGPAEPPIEYSPEAMAAMGLLSGSPVGWCDRCKRAIPPTKKGKMRRRCDGCGKAVAPPTPPEPGAKTRKHVLDDTPLTFCDN
jgi:hypothetical protein